MLMMSSIQTLSQDITGAVGFSVVSNFERTKLAIADCSRGNFVIGLNFVEETASIYSIPLPFLSVRRELWFKRLKTITCRHIPTFNNKKQKLKTISVARYEIVFCKENRGCNCKNIKVKVCFKKTCLIHCKMKTWWKEGSSKIFRLNVSVVAKKSKWRRNSITKALFIPTR